MTVWTWIILFGVSAIWVVLVSALVYLVAAAGQASTAQPAPVRARGLERPRPVRPTET